MTPIRRQYLRNQRAYQRQVQQLITVLRARRTPLEITRQGRTLRLATQVGAAAQLVRMGRGV